MILENQSCCKMLNFTTLKLKLKMRKYCLPLLILLFPFIACCQSSAGFLPQTVIVKLKPEFRHLAEGKGINHPGLNELLLSIGEGKAERKFPLHLPPDEALTRKTNGKAVDLSLMYLITWKGNMDEQKVIAKLSQIAVFEYTEIYPVPTVLYTPNDPQLNLQYHFGRINAFDAYDISKGDTNIVIGITDTGIDLLHPDLVNSIKYNYLDPIDGIDNDNDGYTDNFMGWDLGENDNSPQWNANAHGLHVSGISSATTDNGIGVTGVGFECKFLPIKISNANGALTAAYDGIVYAADRGCQIINNSWGGFFGGMYGQDIVNYAVFNNDALVIASAGNNGNEILFFPASYANVLSVAASDQDDHKKANSTYGPRIDVCAPGEDIVSTWINNGYTASGGTSSAGPVVAGAAAIVKSHFPQLNALQIGEQLKATCDIIDTIPFNLPYAQKLGRGRINLYRALTETNHPSVVLTGHTSTDNNDNAFVQGDTVRLVAEFTNYLNQALQVQVKLSALSPFVQIIDSISNYGDFNTMQAISNSSDPFEFIILPGTPINHSVEFALDAADSSGNTWREYISIILNVDYINVALNSIATTFTSRGTIGYNQPNQTQGFGFVFNGQNLLYEMGLMVGTRHNRVASRVRGTGSLPDADFVPVQSINEIPSATAEFEAAGIFSDAGAGNNAVPLRILHNSYLWSTPGNNRFVIVQFRVVNESTQAIDSVYAGIFADWDIMNSNLNRTGFDSNNQMGYTFSTQSNGLYAGMKLLTHNAPVNYYAIDNISGGAGGINLLDGFSTAEKWQSLSTPRLIAGAAGNGNDVCDVLSSGPVSLAPNDTATFAFALIAGFNLADIQSSAQAAQTLFGAPVDTNTKPDFGNKLAVWPNPNNGTLFVNLPDESETEIRIYSIDGKLCLARLIPARSSGNTAPIMLDISTLDAGMYSLQCLTKSGNTGLKFAFSK
jgi:serine protease